MKIYISGKITGNPYYKQVFSAAEKTLLQDGHSVMNPAILPIGFSWDEYMHVCYAMIDVCDAVYMLNNWRSSRGATAEREYARKINKLIIYEAPDA